MMGTCDYCGASEDVQDNDFLGCTDCGCLIHRVCLAALARTPRCVCGHLNQHWDDFINCSRLD
jgi:hypothetical protein